MIFSAIRPMNGVSLKPVKSASLWHGFLTSFLNPKGLLMYLAVLPQFISPEGSATIQALILLLVFIFGCTTVYTSLGILVASASKSGVSDKFRRSLEAVAGTLLATASARIATQQ
jgi:threonine/homoserine/homoserine lactone efflux protein